MQAAVAASSSVAYASAPARLFYLRYCALIPTTFLKPNWSLPSRVFFANTRFGCQGSREAIAPRIFLYLFPYTSPYVARNAQRQHQRS
jgi:hypothetical protein